MPRIEGTTEQALATLQERINNDPDIQRILQQNAAQIAQTHDRGGDARDFQHRIRDQITRIAKQKGYLPTTDQVFINPNNGQLEGHGGWAGLNTATKTAIIAAAAGAATFGVGSLIGAGAGGAAGAGGGGTAAATGGGGAFASGLPVVAGAPALTGASLVTPWAGAVAPSMIAPGVSSALTSTLPTTAGGGGLLSRLGQSLRSNPGRLAETIGTTAQGIGNRAQADRQAGIDYGLLRDRLGIDNSQNNETNQVNRADLELRQNTDQRADLNNAFDKSLQAELIRGWPGASSMPSRIPTFNVGPTSPTQAARDMAGSMSGQMRSVVDQGGRRGAALPDYQPYQLTSPTERPGASTTERVADIVGLGGNFLSGVLNPPDQVSDLDKWLEIFRNRR